MKTKIAAILAALLMLATIAMPAVSAVKIGEQKEEQQKMSLQEINKQFDKSLELTVSQAVPSGMMTVSATTTTASKYYFPHITKFVRTGYVYDDVAKYDIEIRVGPGEFEVKPIKRYVMETRPYRSESATIFSMFPGQGLTHVLYEERAIEKAKEGFDVYIIGNKEDNIGLELELSKEELNETMKTWSWNKDLEETYYSNVYFKIITSIFSGNKISDIKVVAFPHSLKVKLLDDYDKKDYENRPLGKIDRIIEVDMAMELDLTNKDLININREKFFEIQGNIVNGTYYSDEGLNSLGLTMLAFDPETKDLPSPYIPGKTNDQAFRFANYAGYVFDPSNGPFFHNLDGDDDSLFDVDELEMKSKILNGGLVPYTPLYYDLEVTGQRGGIPEYQTETGNVDIERVVIGVEGGFEHLGDYAAEKMGKIGKEKGVLIITMWYNLGGHASILFADNLRVDRFWQDMAYLALSPFS